MVGVAALETSHRRIVFVDPFAQPDGAAASVTGAESAESAPLSPADYAAKIRSGDVGDIAEARAIGDVARGIAIHTRQVEGVEERTYFDRAGAVVHPDDAELLLSRSRPSDWMLDNETIRDLWAVREQLSGYQGESDEPVLSVFDPRIPLQDVEAIGNAMQWLGRTLGINADRFTLDELTRKIDGRVRLSQQIIARLPQHLSPKTADPESVAASAPGTLTVTLADGGASGPVIDPFAGLAPIATASAPADLESTVPVARSPRYDDQPEEVLPLSSLVPTTIRSHSKERPRGSTWRLRVAAAAATVATLVAASVLAVRSSGSTESAQPKPAIDTSPSSLPPKVLIPSAEQPTAQQQEQAPDSGERTIVLGRYDKEARTGAIWYIAEEDAARLGYPGLTHEQNTMLIDRYLQYMDSRFPGGMNWERAQSLPDEAALPYPPVNTVRAWIGQILAETGQSKAAGPDVSPSASGSPSAAGAQQAQYGIAETSSQPAAATAQKSPVAAKQRTSPLPQLRELRQDTNGSIFALPVTVPLLIARSFAARKRELARSADPKLLRGTLASGRAIWDAIIGPKR